jgi:ribosomal protein L29
MKTKELEKISRPELIKQLSAMREKLRDMKFRIHSKEVKNLHELKNMHKDIARILTIINKKQ